MFRSGHWVNLGLFLVALACGLTYTTRHGGVPVLLLLVLAALALGVLGTLPIGGADMPVVISLLNAFTGTAVAMAGFVLDSTPLIIAGALVGAAGAILTKLMADAMNRSLLNIVAGGFGTGDGGRTGGAVGRHRSARPARTTPRCSWRTRPRSSSSPGTAWPRRRRSTSWSRWRRCWTSTASTSATPSTRSPAGCPGT